MLSKCGKVWQNTESVIHGALLRKYAKQQLWRAAIIAVYQTVV
jgi:hypothetical protein